MNGTTHDNAPMPTHPADHFGRYNAFVDEGHAGELTHVQASVWHAMNRHADADGYACPSNATLASTVRHAQTRHVREAKADLVRRGYLEKTGHKHPRYKTDVYRIIVPRIGPPPPCPDSGHDDEKGPGLIRASHLAPIPPSPCPDSAPHLAPNGGTEQLLEQPKEQKIKKREAAPPVPLPPALDTHEFRGLWAKWTELRQRKRWGRYLPETEVRNLAALEAIGPESATECVNYSITNEYRGLFPERFKRGQRHGNRQPAAQAGLVENLAL